MCLHGEKKNNYSSNEVAYKASIWSNIFDFKLGNFNFIILDIFYLLRMFSPHL